jgi:hypothetical protein
MAAAGTTPLPGDTDVANLNFKINGVDFNLPASANKCKFLIKDSGTLASRDATAVLDPTVLTQPIADRYNSGFLGHIAKLQESAAAGSGWTELKGATEIEGFLKVDDTTSPTPTKVPRNCVVSIQVVLIDAAKAAAAASGNDYDTNDVAIIQFPLYRSNPESATAFGGRRRTKAFKGKSSYRTRKHKKQVGTK